jgi:hypothetical protein
MSQPYRPARPVTGIALSKELNRGGVSLPSPEDGNRSSFRNGMPYSYLEFHKPSDTK